MSRVPGVFLRLAPSACFLLALLPGQNPAELFDKAPPAIDAELRSRIMFFFQAHIDAKPRLADQVVAEESKDFFFAANKPKYLSCEIIKITYKDDFTKANAVVACETFIMMPGFEGKPMKFAAASLWKVIDGKWYWYVEDLKERPTPFGIMKATGSPAGAPAEANPLAALSKGPTVASLRSAVKANKDTIDLKKGGSGEVQITNNLPGQVNLELRDPALKGLTVTLDRPVLRGGESAVLKVTADAAFRAPEGGVKLVVEVQPLAQQITVDLNFTP